MNKNFAGLNTAVVTPFTNDKKIDYKALEFLIIRQIENKVDGLVLLGTTAESPTIIEREAEEIICKAVALAKGTTNIIVGTGSNDTQRTLEKTKWAKDLGADAVLLMTPYYNKPNQEGLYRHFSHVADHVNIPIILYNIAGRTAVNLETSTLKKLAQHDNIIGVKEASGDLKQIMDVTSCALKDFIVLSGDDALTYMIMSLGGHGVVSVIANVLPGEMKKLLKVGDNSRKIHYKLYELMKALLSYDSNPIPIKSLLAEEGLIIEAYRLPLIAMDGVKKQKLLKIYHSLSL